VIKDLDVGLIDFPTLFRGKEVYLCWRMGESGIRHWHGVDEGFAGRKRSTMISSRTTPAIRPTDLIYRVIHCRPVAGPHFCDYTVTTALKSLPNGGPRFQVGDTMQPRNVTSAAVLFGRCLLDSSGRLACSEPDAQGHSPRNHQR